MADDEINAGAAAAAAVAAPPESEPAVEMDSEESEEAACSW